MSYEKFVSSTMRSKKKNIRWVVTWFSVGGFKCNTACYFLWYVLSTNRACLYRFANKRQNCKINFFCSLQIDQQVGDLDNVPPCKYVLSLGKLLTSKSNLLWKESNLDNNAEWGVEVLLRLLSSLKEDFFFLFIPLEHFTLL